MNIGFYVNWWGLITPLGDGVSRTVHVDGRSPHLVTTYPEQGGNKSSNKNHLERVMGKDEYTQISLLLFHSLNSHPLQLHFQIHFA